MHRAEIYVLSSQLKPATLAALQSAAQAEQSATPEPHGASAWRLTLHSALALPALRERLREVGLGLGVDVITLAPGTLPQDVGLVVMDMDSTLITIEVIDELARLHGVGEAVAAITAAAMRGELDFATSLRRRVALLRGLSCAALDTVADNLPLNRGAEQLVQAAKARGVKLALYSGGFQRFAERLQQRLGLDEVAACSLAVVDGALSGELEGTIVDAERKAELLRAYAASLGLKPSQVVAVGDGANDLKMIAAAGLGIALHAKPKVQAAAPAAINVLGLEGVATLLGWS